MVGYYPQHPEKKQRIRLKNPLRWGVCGVFCEVAVSDDNIVSGTDVAVEAAVEAVAAVATVAAVASIAAFSSFTASISSSIVKSLSNAAVWSLLNSIIDSMIFLITPVSPSVCK